MVYLLFSIAFIALNLSQYALATSRSTPPTGALTVGAGGTYSTISEAVAAATSGSTIFIYAGNFTEKVYIDTDNLTVYGQTADTSSYTHNVVTLTYNNSAAAAGSDDGSATLRVHADNFKLYNVNVVNSFGVGSQALAISVVGNEHGYYASSFKGYQDTIETEGGTQYFGVSYVEGAVDYIFGKTGITYFRNSTIASNAPGNITASGSESFNSGIYVFDSCSVQAASDAASSLTGEVNLGRPWRQYATVVFKYCYLSDIISPVGWIPWSPATPNTEDVLLAEYQNTGPGSNTSSRASFSTQLNSSEIASYTISAVLGSTYTSWVDSAYL